MKKYYIQIGAAHGDDWFYRNYVIPNPQGIFIFVEPIQYEELDTFYRDKGIQYSIVNKAIVPQHIKEKEMTMYLYTVSGGKSPKDMSSLMKRMDKPVEREIKVQTLRIHEFLDSLPPGSHIAILQMDIEGLDREVMMSLDLDRYNIESFIFETGQEFVLDENMKFHMKSLEYWTKRKLFFTGYRQRFDSYPEWKSSPKSNEFWVLPPQDE